MVRNAAGDLETLLHENIKTRVGSRGDNNTKFNKAVEKTISAIRILSSNVSL